MFLDVIQDDVNLFCRYTGHARLLQVNRSDKTPIKGIANGTLEMIQRKIALRYIHNCFEWCGDGEALMFLNFVVFETAAM